MAIGWGSWSQHTGALALLLLLLWVLFDIRNQIRRVKEAAQRMEQGRMSEAADIVLQLIQSRRPMALLFNRLFVPGYLEAKYAATLQLAGRNEDGLPWAEKAVRLSGGHARLYPAALSVHVNLLSSLGRYEEARAQSKRLDTLPSVSPILKSGAALTEFYEGHLSAALDLSLKVLAQDSRVDASRSTAAQTLSLLGNVPGAIELLLYEPDPGAPFRTPQALAAARDNADVAETFRALKQSSANISGPGRWLTAADIYVCHEDVGGAEYALERARTLLGTNVVVKMMYHRVRARMLASQGNTVESAKEISQARALLREYPKRSAMYETVQAEAESLLLCGQATEAVSMFEEAGRVALHPIERHRTGYWTARALEAAGRHEDARARYREIASSDIPSYRAAQAKEALKRLGC